MRKPARLHQVFACLLLFPVPYAYGQTLILDSDGRTLAASPSVPARTDITIQIGIADPVAKVCKTTTEIRRGPRTLRYLALREVTAPRLLAESEGETIVETQPSEATATPFVFTIPGNKTAPFVLFNITEAPATDTSALQACWDLVSTRSGARDNEEQAVATQDNLVKELQATIAVLRARVESQRADATTLSRQNGATAEIANILKAVEQTRVELRVAETKLLQAEVDLRKAKEAVAKADDGDVAALGMTVVNATHLVTALNAGTLIKVGGIVTGKTKAVYYDFSAVSPKSSLQMSPMGDYPVLRFGERAVSIIANVVAAQHPYAFHLSAAARDGAVVNTDPVRPTFEIAAGETVIRDKNPLPGRLATTRAFRDVILAIRGAFSPNQYPEVTIATERASDEDPSKRTTVTLVDKAQYPQYRALYRYNFNTGVFASELRTKSFRKVKIANDDPATDVDESRYRIDESEADPTVKPMFGFTYYLKPVDIQAPVSHERWIPNPTLGFAFANPADNIYLGFTHEILRNAQLFWGWHWGYTQELVKRNDVTEDHDSTDPVTRDRRRRAFGVGLTFNVDVIKKIFQ